VRRPTISRSQTAVALLVEGTAADVHCKDAVPILVGDLLERLLHDRAVDRRVVDERVDPAEPLEHRLGEPLGRLPVRDVDLVGEVDPVDRRDVGADDGVPTAESSRQ
jgi:hypothetical protein